MTFLIILLLLGIAFIYAIFFVFFKVIWILLKKTANKWPLILAGISTVLFGILTVSFTLWGVYKIISPFRPMIDRVSQQPEPVFGSHTYVDPQYGFSLMLPDGLDFSEWINYEKMSFKVGINTNVFKKDAQGKKINSPVLTALLIRDNETKDVTALAEVQAAIEKASKDGQLIIEETSQEIIDGNPVFYMQGTAITNQMKRLPFCLTAVYADGHLLYMVASELADGVKIENTDAPQLVQSLRFPALPQPEIPTPAN